MLETRFKLYFEQECESDSIYDIPPPDLELTFSQKFSFLYGFVSDKRGGGLG